MPKNSNRAGTKLAGDWNTCLVRRDWGTRPFSVWRRDSFGGNLTAAWLYVQAGQTDGAGIFTLMHGRRKRGSMVKEERFRLETEKAF